MLSKLNRPPKSIGRSFPTSLSTLVYWPISEFLEALKRLATSSQVLDWLLNDFVKIKTFPFDKVLFVLSFSLFVEDGLDLIFLVWGYLDPSFLGLY
jgi:hypothetical protein